MVRLSALLLVSVVITAPTQASAEPVVGEPTKAQWAMVEVQDNDLWMVECDSSSAWDATAIAQMYSVAYAGDSYEAGFGTWSDTGGSYVGISVDEHRTSSRIAEGERFGAPYDLFGRADDAGTLRAAWASWGDSLSCRVFVNGVEYGVKDLDQARSVRLLGTDFGRGAAALIGPGAAAYALEHDRSASGYTIGILQADMGSLRVREPRGWWELDPGPSSPWVGFASGVPGVWEYHVDVGVGYGIHGVELWVFDLPS